MAVEEAYKGRRIGVAAEGGSLSLSIDDAPVKITRLADGRITSNALPYAAFGSAVDLAKALIDAGLV